MVTHKSPLKKSQIFSLDIILAGGVLIFLLLLLGATYVHIETRFTQRNTATDLQALADNLYLFLFQTTGTPPSWQTSSLSTFNESVISSIGLTNGNGKINPSKLLGLERFSYDSYNLSKELLGIKGPGYEYSITLSSLEGFDEHHGIFPSVAPHEIAYSYGDGSGPSSLHTFLTYHSVPFDDYGNDWTGLLDNATQYSTIILEDTELLSGDSDLTSSRTDKLKSFVYNSGVLFFIGDGTLLNIFNLSTLIRPTQDGEITQLDSSLFDVQTGDTVFCSGNNRIDATNPSFVFLISEPFLGHGLYGYKTWGTGKIYYLCSFLGNISSSTEFWKFSTALAFSRGSMNITSLGRTPAQLHLNSTHVAVREGAGVLTEGENLGKPVYISVRVWKHD